jgi:hypothetical protein
VSLTQGYKIKTNINFEGRNIGCYQKVKRLDAGNKIRRKSVGRLQSLALTV